MSSKSTEKLASYKLNFCDNLTDLFTKSLPLAIFDKCVKCIGIKKLKDLQDLGGEPL
jgi:hypothetical protein